MTLDDARSMRYLKSYLEFMQAQQAASN
jgi:hypothetical protein